jgi:hypothetical protein
MINPNRSWIWLVLILLAYAVWKYYLKPRMDKRNREDK